MGNIKQYLSKDGLLTFDLLEGDRAYMGGKSTYLK